MFRLVVSVLLIFVAVPIGAVGTRNDCTGCHSSLIQPKTGEMIHKPLRSRSSCSLCHIVQSQGSGHVQFKAMTLEAVNDVCLSCHDELKNKNHGSHQLHSVISQKGCVACHSPHKSGFQHLLRKESSSELCLSCHTSKAESVRAAVHHKILGMKQGCLSCHNPHYGGKDGRMFGDKPQAAVCLTCHAKPQVRTDGQALASVKVPRSGAHPPFQEGKCDSCHQVHGSKNEFLIEKNVCFKCHDQSLLTSQKPEATRFRNGSTNLHVLHMSGGQFERSCQTCHEPHESHQARLIRADFVAFGTRVPIQYAPRENGGTCASACHKSFGYNRVEAVKNVTDR